MIALLFSGGFALVFTLFMTPLFVRLFKRIEWGQFIRQDGPQSHHTKRGTPTMGGIVVVLGAALGYVFGHLVAQEPFTLSGLLVLGVFAGLAIVGFIDHQIPTSVPLQPILQQFVLGGSVAVGSPAPPTASSAALRTAA